jgi:hypothetical protein
MHGCLINSEILRHHPKRQCYLLLLFLPLSLTLQNKLIFPDKVGIFPDKVGLLWSSKLDARFLWRELASDFLQIKLL